MNVKLPAATHDRLRRVALERLVSPSLIVARAVDAYLDAIPTLPDVKASTTTDAHAEP
jgi:hypothetical protein